MPTLAANHHESIRVQSAGVPANLGRCARREVGGPSVHRCEMINMHVSCAPKGGDVRSLVLTFLATTELGLCVEMGDTIAQRPGVIATRTRTSSPAHSVRVAPTCVLRTGIWMR